MSGARRPAPTSLRRFGTRKPTGHGVILPAFHPAVIAGRSNFPSRVFAPGEVQRVLKDGAQSRKIGRVVTKGPRAGWPIFTLTLEERATCPRSCGEWASCYGNNMQAAERIEQGDALISALEREVDDLARRYPRGFLIRLHVLGDFWSPEYVRCWTLLLARHRALHLFGFTAHAPDSALGRMIVTMIGVAGWGRAAIRFSGAGGARMAARVLGPGEADAEAIVCPAQTGATACCATCALCWHSDRSIAFRRH